MASVPQRLLDVLRDVLAPLIEADGGELYLVSADDDQVRLHLAGTCCGCPGHRLTTEQVIGPAIRSAMPDSTLEVTAGWIVPEGAERIEAGKA